MKTSTKAFSCLLILIVAFITIHEITSWNITGMTILSNEASAVTTPTAPSAPRYLQALGGNTQVSLFWNAPSSNGGSTITGYKIYRSTSSGSETLLTSIGNTHSYINTGLTNGVKYFYKVTAVNSVSESAKSNEANAIPAITSPSAPQNLQTMAGNTQISLSWKTPMNNGGSTITGYKIYRSTSSGSETFLTTIGNNLSYVNSGLTNGIKYFYKVTAVNSVGESAKSNEASAIPVVTVPSAPQNLQVYTGNAQVALFWKAPANNGGFAITGYKIYRSTLSGSETFLTTIGNNLSYVNSGLANGVKYFYKVSATNLAGESFRSNEVTAIPYAEQPPSSSYPLHQNISTTRFWVGEPADSSDRYISNTASAWDDIWETHYGGVDDPYNRIGYFPVAFTPKENPFYFALPYNDFGNGHRKPEAFGIVYWSHEKTWSPLESMLKNQWIKITKGGKTAYAQWEDVGPYSENDSSYVYGSDTPINPNNNHDGLDVSPAVNDYIGLNGMGVTSWQFVNFADVPAGPWKQIITTSQIYWGP